MKRIILISFCVFLLSGMIYATDLIDVYKTGKVYLKPDSNFAAKTDWNNIFHLSTTFSEKPMSNFGEITISSDGSIFVLNRGDYSIYKFNKNGEFISKFGQEGFKSGEFRYRPSSVDLLDNKYVITSEYSSGRINLFDLNGKFIKAIPLDYPIFDCVALKNNKIAVNGLILYRSKKSKEHIAIIDIDTEKETPVTHFMEDRKGTFSFTYKKPEKRKEIITKQDKEKLKQKREKFKKEFKQVREAMIAIESPSHSFRAYIDKTINGDLIVGYSKDADVVIYSPDGEEKVRFKLNYSPLQISQKEKDEYYQSMENAIKAYNILPDSTLKIINSPGYFPEHLPYFYNITADSDGNILVFKFVKDKQHVFQVYQVYSKEGHFICETTIDPGEFENPKTKLMAFNNGALYGVFQMKDNKEGKIKLVKVNLLADE